MCVCLHIVHINKLGFYVNLIMPAIIVKMLARLFANYMCCAVQLFN